MSSADMFTMPGQPIRVYDTDNGIDYAELMRKLNPVGQEPQIKPRNTVYESQAALAQGLEPVEAVPSIILELDQIEDALREAIENESLPIFHAQHTWRPIGFQWNQGRLGYCWTWSGTGCMMTLRAMEDKDLVYLAPVSMGYLVGWKNAGNYLGSMIKGLREDGVCPAVNGDYNSHENSSRYWAEHDEDRHLYRLDRVWDTDSRRMLQHCASILTYGRSLYAAWNHLAHAMEVLGIRYVNGQPEWLISNSHNKREILIMKGSRAQPSEAYGFVSTVAT